MRLVVAVLGLCRIDILLAVWLFAVAVTASLFRISPQNRGI